VGVAVGVDLLPRPGGGDDLVKGGVLGLPVEVAADFFAGGDQRGGIAGAARGKLVGDGLAGDAAGGVEDLKDGIAGAVADVVGFAGDAVDGFKGEDVGVGDVQDMDVIADTGAVGSGIVGTEDFNVGSEADSSVEDAGD